MNDDQILERGGTEEDIKSYAESNGANLTEKDFDYEKGYNQALDDLAEKLRKRLEEMEILDKDIIGSVGAVLDIDTAVAELRKK